MDYEKQITRFFKRKGISEILGEDYQLTELQHKRFCKLLDVYKTTKNMENMLRTVAYFIKYDLTNYLGRYNRLKGGNGTTTYTQMLRYGRYWKEIYKTQSDKKTKAFTNKTKTWIDAGYTLEESIKIVQKVQTDRAIKASAKTKGTSCHTVRSTEFWMNKGFSEDEAKEKVRAIQTTNGIEFYKKKYPETYEEEFTKRIEKWKTSLLKLDQVDLNLKKSHSIEGALARGLSYEEAVDVYQSNIERMRALRKKPSKISQKMCNMLGDRLDGTCYYQEKNYEKLISGYKVDFYHKESKTVVEFYGDFFHRNPRLYESSFTAFDITSSDRWEYDAKRESNISKSEEVNKLLIVWESDFRKNPERVVQKIIGEIKNVY